MSAHRVPSLPHSPVRTHVCAWGKNEYERTADGEEASVTSIPAKPERRGRGGATLSRPVRSGVTSLKSGGEAEIDLLAEGHSTSQVLLSGAVRVTGMLEGTEYMHAPRSVLLNSISV